MQTPISITKLTNSFSRNSTFAGHIEQSISMWHPIVAGLPHGSCLPPTLFKIYISDIPLLNTSQIEMYADKTATQPTAMYSKDIIINLENALSVLYQYFLRCYIQINISITQLGEPNLPTRNIWINNHNKTWQQDIKNVIIDTKLNYMSHIV